MDNVRMSIMIDRELHDAFKLDAKTRHYRSVPAQVRWLISNHLAQTLRDDLRNPISTGANKDGS